MCVQYGGGLPWWYMVDIQYSDALSWYCMVDAQYSGVFKENQKT